MCSACWIIRRNIIFKMIRYDFLNPPRDILSSGWVWWNWKSDIGLKKGDKWTKITKTQVLIKRCHHSHASHNPLWTQCKKRVRCQAQKSQGACIEVTPADCHQHTPGYSKSHEFMTIKVDLFSFISPRHISQYNLEPWFASPTIRCIRCIQHALTL